jgi:hypothetical protein
MDCQKFPKNDNSPLHLQNAMPTAPNIRTTKKSVMLALQNEFEIRADGT